jgi:hypothetical protein
MFGKKLNLENFTITQLEDTRNKLRTKLSQLNRKTSFNENINNDEYIKTQWMLDAINEEILSREASGNVVESKDFRECMKILKEGEIQQASAIVTAKTMVDRVGRWIEELSGMENDTLLTLGDSIRDEMSQEQAKRFISTVAPAIQTALTNLKTTRETLATGVRSLTGEEQSAEILGQEIDQTDAGENPFSAEPDQMNADRDTDQNIELPDQSVDAFGASEPAAGGFEAAGREKRESIEYQNRIFKVLVG